MLRVRFGFLVFIVTFSTSFFSYIMTTWTVLRNYFIKPWQRLCLEIMRLEGFISFVVNVYWFMSIVYLQLMPFVWLIVIIHMTSFLNDSYTKSGTSQIQFGVYVCQMSCHWLLNWCWITWCCLHEIIIKTNYLVVFKRILLFQIPIMFIEFSASMTDFIGIIKEIICM